MGLARLDEPAELKKQIIKIKATHGSGSRIDWDSVAVWLGNSLPKYLWEGWKNELGEKGFTWQKFLKLMKYRTEDIILWVNDKISWADFMGRVTCSIDGPFSEMIRGG
jgi:hypothetical protein